jgi:hypothetical protein
MLFMLTKLWTQNSSILIKRKTHLYYLLEDAVSGKNYYFLLVAIMFRPILY